jgi:hypothetical protein
VRVRVTTLLANDGSSTTLYDILKVLGIESGSPHPRGTMPLPLEVTREDPLEYEEDLPTGEPPARPP